MDFLVENGETNEIRECAKEIIRIVRQNEDRTKQIREFYRILEKQSKQMSLSDMIVENDPIEVAEQLCLINFKLFKYIHPIEYLMQIWKTGSSGTDKQKRLSIDSDYGKNFVRSLDFFIERFDLVITSDFLDSDA